MFNEATNGRNTSQNVASLNILVPNVKWRIFDKRFLLHNLMHKRRLCLLKKIICPFFIEVFLQMCQRSEICGGQIVNLSIGTLALELRLKVEKLHFPCHNTQSQ